jgi:pimeloyl-ACP methyl ester carboxylesterase
MKRLMMAAGAGMAGLVGFRRRTALGTVPASLAAELVEVEVGPGLAVAIYRRGPESERPVLLIHSVNAAASAAEMRPLFDRLSMARRVVAMDLPGYGRSSRPDIEYTPQLMADAIVAVLERIGVQADVVALSLGCEFAARAAAGRPDLVRSLTLISPTGLQSNQGRSPSLPWLRSLIRAPIVGEAIFGLLSTRLSIDYFLRKSYHGPIDLDMANHAHLTARHPGARYAPASFLSGALFTSHASRTLYEPLEMPVLVIADVDPYTDFGSLPEIVSRRDNWQHHRLSPNRGLPQFDQPEATAELISSFQAE